MPFRDRQGSRRMNTFRFAFRRRPDRVLRYRNREFVVCTGLVQLLLAIGATTAAEPASSRGSASPNKAAAQSPPPKPADSRTVSYVGQEPFPLPAGFSVEQLLRQSPAEAAAKSQSCVQCHQGVGDMHAKPTVRLGCVDCHGGNPGCFTKEGGARAPCPARSLAHVRQSGPLVHAAQPRVARVHPVRQSGRSACRAHQLRRMPRRASAASAQEHDDPRLHAVGCGAVQQRRGAQEMGLFWRELQHARLTPAVADRAPAHDAT